MSQQKILVEKDYLLKKFNGKGGWTFIELPEIKPDKNRYFGWVKVRGFIDDYELGLYPLQSMGNGNLFLPVKAEIRKHIKKQAGDVVRVILFSDDNNANITEELKACLEEVPEAYEKFNTLSAGKQKAYIDWISAAKNDETKVQRIISTIDQILALKK
ncbi:YdeI/OmpD-associated family protein [Pedobacter sp.]|uniref:YdeI/OmpD-associated family protein n=1 Tax=Pedobacter sp. TaxID=1411316 RepID=UPI0031DA3C5F